MSIVYPMSEVRKHRKKGSIWLVIHNDIYDVTAFLNEHPGGADPLLSEAGTDATAAFEDVGHSEDARQMMAKYKIGVVSPQERKSYIYPCCKPIGKKPSCPGPGRAQTAPEYSWRTYDGSPPYYRHRPPPPPLPPPKSNKWKWILLALGTVVVAGVVYKKYVAKG